MRGTSTRRRSLVKWVGVGLALMIALIVVVFARPAYHLLRAALRDGDAIGVPRDGFVDDASRLNETEVAEVVEVAAERAEAEAQLAALLGRARRENLRVSIAGSRHTMGGHTIYPGGIAIDMRGFDDFSLDEDANILHVQSGARWDQIIPWLNERGRSLAVMQSNNSFTVGGSISANCHGWQPNRPPIASTVESFRLMKADGAIVRCSREENEELFSLALGGYGLFGIILDIELRIVPNERYVMQRFVIDSDEVADVFAAEVSGRGGVGMAYARLRVTQERFLQDAVVNVFRASPCEPAEMPPLSPTALAGIKRSIFRGSVNSEYGKQLRWNAEVALSDRLSAEYVSRNQLLNDPVALYQDRSAATTDILHEYFIPVGPGGAGGSGGPEAGGFNEFVNAMRSIIPQHRGAGDLLNVTVRHVLADDDTYLRYADRNGGDGGDGGMLALVLLFSQARTNEADAKMQGMTQALIDAALAVGGRYYLPYRLHATPEQFHAAYPQATAFFALKRKYDPQELFQNQFYVKYGREDE